jgi:phosphatidate cytidylyltransferase
VSVKGDLRRRLLVAAVGIPASVIVVYAGGVFLALGLGFLAAVGFWEYAGMLRETGYRPFLPVGILTAIILPFCVLDLGFGLAWVVGVVALAGGSAWAIFRLEPAERPISNTAITMFGALYLGGFLSFGIPLREWFLPGRVEGTLLFFYPVVVTWLADTAAYAGGKSFGKRQLSPVISPNKTIEGAVSAVIAGAVAALLYGMWVLPAAGGVVRSILFGIFVSVLAILGDLVESALKRECGQKDSSGLLPGHGGFLDRLDSLLWAIPGAYVFFWIAGL